MRREVCGSIWLGLVCIAAVWLGISVGTSGMDWGWRTLWHPSEIIWTVRWPRVLLAAFAGAGLSVAGVTFQALLRNPLADPYVVGVSGGAALGGVLALTMGVSSAFGLPLWAFAGAVASTVVLFGVARSHGRASDPVTLLLTGVIFNAFASAVVTLIKTLVAPSTAQSILFWLMGVIGVEPPLTLWMLAGYVGSGVALLTLMGGALNVLSLGDDTAASLGLAVNQTRIVAFLIAAMLVGAIVAVAGMIGFVGLIVPHVLRRVLSHDHRWLIPAAACGGAAFLVLADTLARWSFYRFGTELPVGVVTAFTGGPFFLALLLRRKADHAL